MKATKLILAVFFITAVTIYAQPMMPPPTVHENLGELLNLSKSQNENVESIIKKSKLKIEKLKKQERAAVEKYRKNMKNILDSSNVQISRLLNKTQAAKFKEITENMKARGMKYPAPMNDLPQRGPEMPPPPMPQRSDCNIPPDPGFEPGNCMRGNPSFKDDDGMLPDMSLLEMLLDNDNTFTPDSLNGR